MLVKKSPELRSRPRRILLIQLGDIGDVVLTIPTIRVLRDNFPDSKIIVCVKEKARDVISDCPWADGLIAVIKRKRRIGEEIRYQHAFIRTLRAHRFDLVIDLRTGTRGAILGFLSGSPIRLGRWAEDGTLWRNRLFTHLVRPENESDQYAIDHNLNIIQVLGLEIRRRLPGMKVPQCRHEQAKAIFQQEKVPLDRPIVAIHPFSLWQYKEWGIDQIVPLIDHIHRRYGFSVIITGAPEERVHAAEVARRCRDMCYNLAGKTSIGVLASVLQHCAFFIGVDTAALHIAAAVGVPTLGIFGPSAPVSWAPRGDQHSVVSKSYACVPCRQKGCRNSEISRCLTELTFEDIQPRVDHTLFALQQLNDMPMVAAREDQRPIVHSVSVVEDNLISILVVNYNTVDMLHRCLQSVRQQNGIDYEIVVVDNASIDGSQNMVRENFPWVRLITNKENCGFSRANNQAIGESRGRYYFFLNPDTELKKDALATMAEFMDRNPDVGLAGSRILNPDLTPQPSVELSYPGERYARKELRGLSGNIAWVLGAAMIARRQVIETVGGFDETFFLYGEDLDLCLKIRKLGWRIGYIPQSVVIHWGGQSERNTLPVDVWRKKLIAEKIFYRKHYSGRTRITIHKANQIQALLKILMLQMSLPFQGNRQKNIGKLTRYKLALRTFREN